MTEYNLEDKIKLLKQIKPDNEWKKSTRAFLLSECQSADLEQNTEQVRNRLWIPVKLFRFRPVMAAALVVIFTIVGCAYGLNISKRSLPGDMFWNVKVSLEKAQVSFSSGEARVKLEAELAGKRLKELRMLPLETDPKVVAQAVENFKVHINEAKEGLKELDKSELNESRKETHAAITNTEDEWEEELIKKIEGKLSKVESEVKGDSEVKGLIREAEALLEEGKLGEGEKLVEALILLDEVEKILEAKKMVEIAD